MNLQKVITEARRKGICKEWADMMLHDESVENLCRMYFEGSDWAMEKDFPDISILREFKGKTEEFGIFTDANLKSENVPSKTAFFGDSKAELIFRNYDVAIVYARHNTDICVNASGYSKIFINALDYANIKIEASENAEVIVCNYGSNTQINGNARIIASKF